MLVIMPLITGGALTGLLHKFGVRLPPSVERLFGGSPRGSERFGSREKSVFERDGRGMYESRSVRTESGMGGSGMLGTLAGGMEGVGSAMKIARMFM